MVRKSLPFLAMKGAGRLLVDVGFLVYVALLPFEHLAGVRPILRVALVAACAAGLFLFDRRPVSGIEALFALFLLGSSLSIPFAESAGDSLHEASRALTRQAAAFLLASRLFSRGDRRDALARTLAASSLLLTAVCLALWIAGERNPWGGLTGPGMGYNSVAMLLVPAAAFLPLLGGAAAFALATAVAAAILGTVSRIGWGALVVLAAVWFVRERERRRAVAAGLALAAGLFLALLPSVGALARITDNHALSKGAEADMRTMAAADLLTMNDRLTYAWKPALALFRARPIAGWGYGPGTFRRNVPGAALPHEHSAFLSVAVQSGLLGLVPYLALLGAVLARLVTRTGPLATAFLGAVTATYLFHALGEPTNNGPSGILFAILAGMTAALPESA